MGKQLHNSLTVSIFFGGGNSGKSELASSHAALIRGRLLSFFYAMVVALFVFSFFSCSGDEETEKSTFSDYKTAFTAHEWEISSAEQHLGYLLLDVKEAPTYCRFTSDSIYFSEKEMVYHFDADGKITKSGYEISPCGSFPYAIQDNKIKIDKQIFTITSTDSSYVLDNADWLLVLINK